MTGTSLKNDILTSSSVIIDCNFNIDKLIIEKSKQSSSSSSFFAPADNQNPYGPNLQTAFGIAKRGTKFTEDDQKSISRIISNKLMVFLSNEPRKSTKQEEFIQKYTISQGDLYNISTMFQMVNTIILTSYSSNYDVQSFVQQYLYNMYEKDETTNTIKQNNIVREKYKKMTEQILSGQSNFLPPHVAQLYIKLIQ